jgi:hypothetical protein
MEVVVAHLGILHLLLVVVLAVEVVVLLQLQLAAQLQEMV